MNPPAQNAVRLPDETKFSDLDRDPSMVAYWKALGTWLVFLPGVGLCNCRMHTVTEHEDGTATFEPSILVNNGLAHGWLRRGRWTPC